MNNIVKDINESLEKYNKLYSSIILENQNILDDLEKILSIDGIIKNTLDDTINNFEKLENIQDSTNNIINILNIIYKQNNFISTFLDNIKDIDIYSEKYNYSLSKKTEINAKKNIYIKKAEEFLNLSDNILNDIYDKFALIINSNEIDINYLKYLSDVFQSNHEIINFYVYIFNYILDNKENISNEFINNIKNIIDNNKNNVLKIKNSQPITYSLPTDYNNMLQTFNLVKYIPKDNKICNISKTLFNFDSKYFNNFNEKDINDKTIKNIINELLLIISTYDKCGILLMYKTGNNIYYNIQKLYNQNAIPIKDYGIYKEYIELFKLLIEDNNNSVKDESILIPININKDTEKVIVIETTNMITYRLLSNKYIEDENISNFYIPMYIINNILRNKPSERIDKINNIISDKILSNIDPDLKTAYNDMVNLDFDSIYEKDIYIKLLDQLFDNIKNLVKKSNKKNIITKKEFIDIFMDDEFKKIVEQTIINFYFDNIQSISKKYTEELSATYLSEADILSRKIIKDFVDCIPNLDNNIDYQSIIKSILDILINKNINIYDIITEKNYILQSFAI